LTLPATLRPRPRDGGGGAQVLDAALVQEPMKTLSIGDVGHRRARRQAHVFQRALGRSRLASSAIVGRVGHDAGDRHHVLGLVPQVTCGAMSAASSVTSGRKTRRRSAGRVRQ
jgi:hypothetical protein